MAGDRTTTELLNGLHDPDNTQAWTELDERCRPIMLQVALRIGLNEVEAEDVVQSAMATFLQAYQCGQYDRDRGRLSAYLVTILRSRAIDFIRKEKRHLRGNRPETGLLDDLSDDRITRFWLDERQNQLLRHALDELRKNGVEDRTLSAFELFGIRGVGIDEVTSRLGMSRDEVYNAKYRITQRLRPIVARLDELYEDL